MVHNVHRHQRQLSKSLMRFSCLLPGRGAILQDGVAAGKRLFMCSVLGCPDLWLHSSSTVTVNGLEKTQHEMYVFPNSARTSRCTVITDLNTSKRSTQKAFFLLLRHLGKWPRNKHEKRTTGGVWETWTVASADGERYAPCMVRNKFLVNF
jgi:hypothetical protein